MSDPDGGIFAKIIIIPARVWAWVTGKLKPKKGD